MKTALSASPRRRAPYRIRGERVWACIRARYLAGESAPALAAEFDVSVYAIRRRITREGWSKRGLAEAEDGACPEVGAGADPSTASGFALPCGSRSPSPLHGEETDVPLEPRAAARAALDEAVRLLRSGRLGAAGAAARVADVMGRAAARLEAAEPAAEEAGVDEAAFEAVRRKVLGLASPQGGDLPPPPPCGRSPSPVGGGLMGENPPLQGEGDREAVEGVKGGAR